MPNRYSTTFSLSIYFPPTRVGSPDSRMVVSGSRKERSGAAIAIVADGCANSTSYWRTDSSFTLQIAIQTFFRPPKEPETSTVSAPAEGARAKIDEM